MHNLTELYLICDKPLVTAREGEIVACFLILRIMIGTHESLADVDGNEHCGDQFRVGIRNEPNKRSIRKSLRNLSFLSRRGCTRGSIGYCYSDVPAALEVAMKRHAQFHLRKLLTRTRRGQRFEPTHLPSFIEMSGLRLPSPRSRRYEQDEREVGSHPRHPS